MKEVFIINSWKILTLTKLNSRTKKRRKFFFNQEEGESGKNENIHNGKKIQNS